MPCVVWHIKPLPGSFPIHGRHHGLGALGQHDYVYPLVIGFAAVLATATERDLAFGAARNALLVFLAAGLLLIPFKPSLVLDASYTQGLLPGVPRLAGLAPHAVSLGMRSESLPRSAIREREGRYIYIACPWTPMGGGMFKVADYLIQAQASSAAIASANAAELRPLDTRGGANALYSFWVLATALARIARGRLSGRLAGVHVLPQACTASFNELVKHW